MIHSARLLLLLILCLAGCATVPRTPENQLVGQWRYENAQQQAEYTFAKDGTFTGHVIVGGKLVADFGGNWSLAEGAISYEYRYDRKGNIAAGTRDRDQLVSVTPDAFVIEARDGSQRKYLRVAE